MRDRAQDIQVMEALLAELEGKTVASGDWMTAVQEYMRIYFGEHSSYCKAFHTGPNRKEMDAESARTTLGYAIDSIKNIRKDPTIGNWFFRLAPIWQKLLLLAAFTTVVSGSVLVWEFKRTIQEKREQTRILKRTIDSLNETHGEAKNVDTIK